MTVRVFNAGVPGNTTRELLARFQRDVAMRAPELVILWAGVNDRLYPGHTLELPEFEESYRELLERIEAIGAEVVFPVFAEGENGKDFTDFNDLATKSRLGKIGLEQQVAPVIEKILADRQAQAQTQAQSQARVKRI